MAPDGQIHCHQPLLHLVRQLGIGSLRENYKAQDHPREIYAIPEVRAFYKQLWEVWPYWLYFCNLDTENLMMMVMCCLESLDALKVKGQSQVKVSISPLEVVRFISGGFVPMNEMCERAGMSERQIFDRTKAVFEYFNLPFDVGM